MTTTQPAALPELPEPSLQQGKYGYRLSHEDYYTADQMRARDAMWAERLAALQPQPAAAVSDEEIERIFKKCGGKWNGDHWVIEDADLHPAIQEFLALRPQAVPSLDTLKQHLACDIECSVYENTVLPAIERWECHHRITAQGAQGGEG